MDAEIAVSTSPGRLRRGGLIATLLLAAFYVAIGFALRLPITDSKVPVSGDEQHYLTQAQSIIDDGDLVVLNNYEEGDYERYYGSLLDASLWNLRGAEGYSGHSPGAGVLVAPGLWLMGWPGVVITLAVGMAGSFALVVRAMAISSRGPLTGRALVVLTAGFASLPLLSFSHTLYPESFMAPLLAGVVLLVVVHSANHTGSKRTASAIGAITLGGLAIGLHPKYAILLAGVTLYFVGIELFDGLKDRGSTSILRAVYYLLTAGLWTLLFSWFHWMMWGTFSPTGWWTEVSGDMAVDVNRTATQFLDLFFGRELGVFVLVPVALLSLPFVIESLRRRNPLECRLVVIVLVLVITVAGPAAVSADWHAGDSPLGRYASPLVPALLLVSALFVTSSERRRGQSTFLGLLIGLGSLSALAYTGIPLAFRPEPFGTGGLLGALSETDYFSTEAGTWLWTASGPSPWIVSTVLFAVGIGVAIILFRAPHVQDQSATHAPRQASSGN